MQRLPAVDRRRQNSVYAQQNRPFVCLRRPDSIHFLSRFHVVVIALLAIKHSKTFGKLTRSN